jgi:hypothetical protein
MKKIIFTVLVICSVFFCGATTHVMFIASGTSAFADITVALGDTIVWTTVGTFEGPDQIQSATIPVGATPWIFTLNSSLGNVSYVPAVTGTYYYTCQQFSGNPFYFTVLNPTSVQKVPQTATYRIFPNPAADVLNVSSPRAITHMMISNFTGEALYAHDYNTDNAQIDVSGMPPGIYIIKINYTEIQQFVKE